MIKLNDARNKKGHHWSRDGPFFMKNSGEIKMERRKCWDWVQMFIDKIMVLQKTCYDRNFVKMNKTPRQKNSSYRFYNGIT